MSISGLSTSRALASASAIPTFLGQQAEREARGKLARDQVLLGDILGVEALAGRHIHDVDHGGGIEPELLADQQRLRDRDEGGARDEVVERLHGVTIAGSADLEQGDCPFFREPASRPRLPPHRHRS